MSETSIEPSETHVEPTAEELEAQFQAWQAERDQRAMQLRRDARAVFAAMQGWQRITTPEAWVETAEQAGRDYRTGRFFIERLGAERHLEPELMATLWGLRQKLVAESGKTAAEQMLADVATVAYYNALRVQRWIGDLSIAIENEFFGQSGPSARFEERYGRVEGLVLEAQLERMAEELLPLQERANRMLVRNLKALAELRRGPTPSVAINQAGQVNVGAQQVNVTQSADPPVTPRGPRRRPGSETLIE
jgi:hypothetical protein